MKFELSITNRAHVQVFLQRQHRAMSKANAIISNRSKTSQHHNTLEDDLVATGPLRTKSKKRKIRREDDTQGYVDSRSSRKILRIGQELVEEEEQNQRIPPSNPAFTFDSRFGSKNEEDEDIRHDDDEAWGDDDDEAWGDDDEEPTEEVV